MHLQVFFIGGIVFVSLGLGSILFRHRLIRLFARLPLPPDS